MPIDHTTDHSMTYSIYINDPDGNGIELFCNAQTTAEEGLAEMRAPGRKKRGVGVRISRTKPG